MTSATHPTDEAIANADVIQPADRAKPYLPRPPSPAEGVDSELYIAWKQHITNGFRQNNEMFKKVLDAFMRPYWMTVWMYRLMFVVGILGFVAAVVLGVLRGAEFAAIFSGLSVMTFLAFFVSQPLRSLEQNIQLITWLGIIYNTYWTRLMYANRAATIQHDLESIAKAAIEEINQLVDKHAELAGKRPGLAEDRNRPSG